MLIYPRYKDYHLLYVEIGMYVHQNTHNFQIDINSGIISLII